MTSARCGLILSTVSRHWRSAVGTVVVVVVTGFNIKTIFSAYRSS